MVNEREGRGGATGGEGRHGHGEGIEAWLMCFFFGGGEMSPRAGVYILGEHNDATQHSSEKIYTQAVSHVAEMNLRDYLSGGRGR